MTGLSLSVFKSRWYWVLFAPIFLNFLFNIAGKFSLLKDFNYYNLGSTVLGFLSFVLLGIVIKENLNLNSISLGIVFYLLSFFIVDIFILFITNELSFEYLFIFTNLFWLILFLIKRKKLNYLFLFLINFLFLRIYNTLFFSKFFSYSSFEVDTWYYFEFCKQIVENSFYFSMNNNIFPGYSQFSSYFHSVFFEYFYSLEKYVYLKPTSNILFFLTCLFFYEISSEKKIKYLALSLYIVLILNSDWLKFLFIDSIMSEGILNYLYAVLLFNIFNEKRVGHLRYVYLFFGLLAFSKQFYILLVLLNLIFLLLFKDSRKFVIFGFMAYFIKQIIYLTYFSSLQSDHHISQIDIYDTVFDLLLFRNLNLNNIITILQNLLIDRPLAYLFFVIFIFIIYLLLNKQLINRQLIFLAVNIVSNFLFVFLLYISVWRNMELDSPIRFILNLFLVSLLFISNSVQAINSKNSLNKH